jgi:SM-20-related protein
VNVSPQPISQVLEWKRLAADLSHDGWSKTDRFARPSLVARLLDLGLSRQAQFRAAGTGHGASFKTKSVRGDRIHWLELGNQGSAVEKDLAVCLEAMRAHLNQSLFLNLTSIEAHLAVYAPGEGYARHRDRFRDDDARTVSWVLYLNDDWLTCDAGALRLHLPTGPMDVLPLAGRAVTFMSADIEHEVCITQRERWSVAAWFRQGC